MLVNEVTEKELVFSYSPTNTNAIVRVSKNTDSAWLDSLTTPIKDRGKGGANQVMKQITDFADKHKLKLQLSAVPLDKVTDQKKLKAFYKKYGFVGKDLYLTRNPNMHA